MLGLEARIAAPLWDLQTAFGPQRLVKCEPGRAAIEYLAGAHIFQSGGVVEGSFVCGWLNDVLAYAALTGGKGMTPMSLELEVSFLACSPWLGGRRGRRQPHLHRSPALQPGGGAESRVATDEADALIAWRRLAYLEV